MQTFNSFMLFYFAVFFTAFVVYLYKTKKSRLEALQLAATYAFNRVTVASKNPNFELHGARATLIERREAGGTKNMPLEVHIVAENIAKERFLFIWTSDRPETPYVKHLSTPAKITA